LQSKSDHCKIWFLKRANEHWGLQISCVVLLQFGICGLQSRLLILGNRPT
jgi:hypothetical protein